jgi:hypothetical protein
VRLLGVGCALLLAGAAATARAEDPPPAAPPPKAPLPAGEIDKDDAELARALTPVLEARGEWKELLALRRELRPALPADRDAGLEGLKAPEAVRGKLDRAARLVDALAVTGALAPAAAEFLRRDVHELSRIAQRLAGRRRGEEPPPEPPETAVEANLRFLADALAPLEEVAFRTGPRPELTEDLLEALEPRLALLAETRVGFGLTAERRKAAAGLRNSLKAVLEALRRPQARALEKEPRWAKFLAIQEHARALLTGKATWPGAKAGWETLLASLDEASKLLESLAADGTLGEGETLWVRRDYGPALDEVRRKYQALREERMTARDPNDPIPAPVPTCVDPPDFASHKILKGFLPALEKIAAQERVRPEMVLRVCQVLEPHLERLARQPRYRDDAATVRTKALLAAVKSK